MVDLNHVVRETLALRAYEQRVTNITVIDALASGLPQVFADPHQLQQVLLNLVINAEQAMLSANGRGTLVVRTWHERDARRRRPRDQRRWAGRAARTCSRRSSIPFFTTKEVGKGTGLGPDRRLRDRPGARRPDPHRVAAGRGASFFVELPTDDGTRARAGAGADRGASSKRSRARRVLVVEDEPALAAAVADALTRRGVRGGSGGRRRRGARARARAHLRPGGLRPEDAAARRHARSTAPSPRRRRRSRAA